MKRRSYDSVQVLLHWLLAVSVIISLVSGKLNLKNLPHDVTEECAESLGNH
jgi:cytochrome b561